MYQVSVFLHVIAACVWVGGIFFFALVLAPALRGSRDAKTMALVRSVGLRFRKVGWLALAVLLVTGVTNLSFRLPMGELARVELWSSPWGRLLATKLGLVTVMIAISVWHDRLGARAVAAAAQDPTSVTAAGWRRQASWLGRGLGVVALAIVFVAVLLVRGF